VAVASVITLRVAEVRRHSSMAGITRAPATPMRRFRVQ
jgi:hypothetical protein